MAHANMLTFATTGIPELESFQLQVEAGGRCVAEKSKVYLKSNHSHWLYCIFLLYCITHRPEYVYCKKVKIAIIFLSEPLRNWARSYPIIELSETLSLP